MRFVSRRGLGVKKDTFRVHEWVSRSQKMAGLGPRGRGSSLRMESPDQELGEEFMGRESGILWG